jgi:hypothetical protein
MLVRVRGSIASLFLVSALAACSDDEGGNAQDEDEVMQPDAGGDGDGDGEDAAVDEPVTTPEGPWFACSDADESGATVVPAHVGAHHFWTGWEEGKNARILDAEADFPAEGSWSKIYLKVKVECPDNGCDPWDRAAMLALVEGEGEGEQPIELARHMTPYKVGMCFMADVTDFASRLRGKKKIRSFVDTWVGPGSGHGGDGWKITSSFIMQKGQSADADELIPLWNNQAEDRLVELGDPMKPIAAEMPERTVKIPADAKSVKLRYIVTGHGQGNAGNCAEFCKLDYVTTLGDMQVKLQPWRDDCPSNPVSVQYGTWMYPRAGWCPGSYVAPVIEDITALVQKGKDLKLNFTVSNVSGEDFVNTCRPMAGDENNACFNCVTPGANSCDYNNNGHTPPQARVSVQLLVYR